jgi:hypothetical protein
MTKYSSLKFKITQLRQEKVINAIESVTVFMFCIFLSVFLPNLLFRFVYANQQLTETPKVLENLPVAIFVVGVGYFLYAMLGNLLRSSKIRRLEKELDEMVTMSDACCSDCNGNCNCSDHGGCNCGCDVDMMNEPMSTGETRTKESVGLLAEKMKSANKKKARRK